MTKKKILRRPALAGSGRRLLREEVEDLEACFAGKQASAWCLLLVEYAGCRAEIADRWREWEKDHPGAVMPAEVARFLGEGAPQ